VLSMADFVALGVLRHLRGMTTLREQVEPPRVCRRQLSLSQAAMAADSVCR
jgi:hypothetical protein